MFLKVKKIIKSTENEKEKREIINSRKKIVNKTK